MHAIAEANVSDAEAAARMLGQEPLVARAVAADLEAVCWDFAARGHRYEHWVIIRSRVNCYGTLYVPIRRMPTP